MSDQVFPQFLGQGWSIIKRPVAGRTLVSTSSSGMEVRLAAWSRPVWEFELTFEFVQRRQPYGAIGYVPRAAALVTAYPRLIADDFAALAGFFMARQGSFDSWLFDDPTDDAITQEIIGTSDGVITTFQAARRLGEFLEPLQNLNTADQGLGITWAASTLYGNAVTVLPTPPAIRLAVDRQPTFWQSTGWPCGYRLTAGGTSGAAEPDWRNLAPVAGMSLTDGSCTWLNVGPLQALYLALALPAWAAGARALGYAVKPTSGNAGGFAYVVTAAGTTGGGAPTWSQTVGATVSDGGVTWTNVGALTQVADTFVVPQPAGAWSQSATGLITLAVAPTAYSNVYLTSPFYFRCRFKEDLAEFEEFQHNYYKLGKLSFISLKQ